MNGKKSILVLTTTTAPYRVDLFNELGKYVDLTVCFEQSKEPGRNDDWYKGIFSNFKGYFLKKADRNLATLKLEFGNYIKKVKPDGLIFYEYSTPTAVFFMIISMLRRIPYFINCDGGFPEESTWIKKKIKSLLIITAKGCFAGGSCAKSYLLYYGAKENKITIHNFTSLYSKDIIAQPLNADQKNVLRQKLNIRGKKVVLAVGRFIKLKRFEVLIKAWVKVNPDYELLLIGSGDNRQTYRNLITDLKLNNVTLIDFMNKEKLFDYYKAADLLVLPTSSDVWGLVINEAMACGLPVITTSRCIAGVELINDSLNGFIVTVEDADGLVEKINNILNDDILRSNMAINNLKKIQSFTFEYSAKAHADLIHACL